MNVGVKGTEECTCASSSVGAWLQVTLVPTEMVELKGVRMIRYLVDNETWAVNETLYNSIPVHLPPPPNSL